MTGNMLVLENDASLAELLRNIFEQEGFFVRMTTEGTGAMAEVERSRPDIAILDWKTPGVSGLDVCRRLRHIESALNPPVVILTAKAVDAEELMAFENEADDYFVKPFSPLELIARIKAIMRRRKLSKTDEVLHYEDILMNMASHRVSRRGKSIVLGPTEFRLLRHFMENPTRVFSREQLLTAIWGTGVYVECRTIDVHIRRLRRALNHDHGQNMIRTVRSVGYSLDVAAGN
jgi:two-component system, OmpR family, phosphate regulon response regulator PhoB